MNKLLIIALTILALGGCKTNKAASEGANVSGEVNGTEMTETPVAVPEMPVGGNVAAVMPKAVVYKTTKDFFYNVPVMLSSNGTGLASYPDPADIVESQLPVRLADGYLLDRRGIGPKVAFTSYTYEQYHALGFVPGEDTLMKSIIDKYPLVVMYQLPINAVDAVADTAAVNTIIKGGFKGCVKLFERPVMVVK